MWDKKTGEAIYPAIVWQDRRTAEFCEKLSHAEVLVSQKTGLVLDPYFSGTKIRWLLDNVPGAKKEALEGHLAFGTIDTWLLWKLTNGASHATDPSNACRTLLLNLKTLKWDEELLNLIKESTSMSALCQI